MIKMTQTGFRELPEIEDKFESQDLPKILAALKKAKDAKVASRLTVDLSENGGVISIQLEMKQKFK